MSFDFDGKMKDTVPDCLHECLLWVHRTFDHDKVEQPGELIFPSDLQCSPRVQYDTSAKLLIAFAQVFHRCSSKVEWHSLQQQNLTKIHESRKALRKFQDKFQELLSASYERRRGPKPANTENEEDSL
jgi:hypothetical protein